MDSERAVGWHSSTYVLVPHGRVFLEPFSDAVPPRPVAG